MNILNVLIWVNPNKKVQHRKTKLSGSRIFSRGGGGGGGGGEGFLKNFKNFVDLFIGRPNWFSELFLSTKKTVLAKFSAPKAKF